MHFHIHHVTRYTYSRPVFIEPMTVRLRPRSDCTQQLLSFEMEIDPAPDGAGQCIDLDGDDTTHAWFSGLHDHLTITTRYEVRTLRTDPFHFVIPADASRLPMTYDPHLVPALEPYCRRDAACEAVDTLANGVLDRMNRDTLGFLNTLTQHLYETVKIADRDEGSPLTPAQTLASRVPVACRDTAVLFMDACRSVGLAARFVSGCVYTEPEPANRPLHAWAEVYLPGGGWRGYDPTNGLAVGDQHVALAAGAHSLLAAPTTGGFRGTGVTSALDTHITMRPAP